MTDHAQSGEYLDRIRNFMRSHVYPAEAEHVAELNKKPYAETSVMKVLRKRAKAKGLWNLFLPRNYGDWSPGLSNREYAPLAEEMGRSEMGPDVFNCAAPDTGNCEVLARYGSPEQQERWLKPLLEGEIRSAFSMSEVAVASSDATNIETSIVREGNEYVINGHKYYTSNAMHEQCTFVILMGKTSQDETDKYKQQSQVIVPLDTPGIEIVKDLSVFGYTEGPGGHAEIKYNNVRIPVENLILGEGRGFEIAQGRLGPGRIHHCMRLVGRAQRAFEMMCRRAESREAFGKKLSRQQSVREAIAQSACDIEQARLLTLKAAEHMDLYGNKQARDLIAMIKIVAPSMACRVIDRSIQIHGSAGVSQDTILARSYAYARKIRLADGPDEVHMMQLGRNLAKRISEETQGDH